VWIPRIKSYDLITYEDRTSSALKEAGYAAIGASNNDVTDFIYFTMEPLEDKQSIPVEQRQNIGAEVYSFPQWAQRLETGEFSQVEIDNKPTPAPVLQTAPVGIAQPVAQPIAQPISQPISQPIAQPVSAGSFRLRDGEESNEENEEEVEARSEGKSTRGLGCSWAYDTHYDSVKETSGCGDAIDQVGALILKEQKPPVTAAEFDSNSNMPRIMPKFGNGISQVLFKAPSSQYEGKVGFIFNYVDEQTHYRAYADFQSSRLEVLMVRNGLSTVLMSKAVSSGFRTDQKFHALNVAIEDDHFTVHFDDQFIGDGTAQLFNYGITSGGAGIFSAKASGVLLTKFLNSKEVIGYIGNANPPAPETLTDCVSCVGEDYEWCPATNECYGPETEFECPNPKASYVHGTDPYRICNPGSDPVQHFEFSDNIQGLNLHNDFGKTNDRTKIRAPGCLPDQQNCKCSSGVWTLPQGTQGFGFGIEDNNDAYVWVSQNYPKVQDLNKQTLAWGPAERQQDGSYDFRRYFRNLPSLEEFRDQQRQNVEQKKRQGGPDLATMLKPPMNFYYDEAEMLTNGLIYHGLYVAFEEYCWQQFGIGYYGEIPPFPSQEVHITICPCDNPSGDGCPNPTYDPAWEYPMEEDLFTDAPTHSSQSVGGSAPFTQAAAEVDVLIPEGGCDILNGVWGLPGCLAYEEEICQLLFGTPSPTTAAPVTQTPEMVWPEMPWYWMPPGCDHQGIMSNLILFHNYPTQWTEIGVGYHANFYDAVPAGDSFWWTDTACLSTEADPHNIYVMYDSTEMDNSWETANRIRVYISFRFQAIYIVARGTGKPAFDSAVNCNMKANGRYKKPRCVEDATLPCSGNSRGGDIWSTVYYNAQGAIVHKGYRTIVDYMAIDMYKWLINSAGTDCIDTIDGGGCLLANGFDVVVGGMSMGGGVSQILVLDLMFLLADHPVRVFHSILASSRAMHNDHTWWQFYDLVYNYGGWHKSGLNSAFYDKCSGSGGYKRQDPTVLKGCDACSATATGIPSNGACSSVGPYERFEFYQNYHGYVTINSGWTFGAGHWQHALWGNWFTASSKRLDYARSTLNGDVKRCFSRYGSLDSFDCTGTDAKTCKYRKDSRLKVLPPGHILQLYDYYSTAFYGLHSIHVYTLPYGSPKINMPWGDSYTIVDGWN